MKENKEKKKQNFIRDGNGKFVSPPRNPDCEPATKGFVRCLMRKGMNHRHGWTSGDCVFSIAACVFGWGLTFILSLFGFIQTSPGVPTSPLAAYWAPFAFVFSLVISIVLLDIINSDGVMSEIANKGEILKEFKKYEPPTCEKEECD